MTRITRDAYGLQLATAAAARADCTRRQVGAVIVSPDGSVVATGYNGLAAGRPGCASAGACPRGQMAYPTPAPVSVGEPDTVYRPLRGAAGCDARSDDGWRCTLAAADGHLWHVASTGVGSDVLAVWTDKPTQPADVAYEATGCRSIHAEVNAIIRAGRDRCIGATIYVTDDPCFHCSVVIEGAGIVRVVTPNPCSEVVPDGLPLQRGKDDHQDDITITIWPRPAGEDGVKSSGPLDPAVYDALVRAEARRRMQ